MVFQDHSVFFLQGGRASFHRSKPFYINDFFSSVECLFKSRALFAVESLVFCPPSCGSWSYYGSDTVATLCH